MAGRSRTAPAFGYCLFLDTGACDEWTALYTDDGQLVREDGQAVVGAVATSVASVIVIMNGAVSSGRARDELCRMDDQWRIGRRTFTRDPR